MDFNCKNVKSINRLFLIYIKSKVFFIGKTIGIVDKDVTVIDLEKRPDKDKIMKELEQLTGEKFNILLHG